MKIGVIGATGGTGGLIVSQLIDAGHDVRAMVRRGADEDRLRETGAEVTTLDLTRAGEDAEVSLSGLDAVINAAAARGTGGGQTRAVDQDGVKAAIDAAKKAGVRRWIQISMWGSDDPSRLPAMLRETADAKRAADDHLAASGMTWTVIRPPWLTDSAPDDRVIVGDQVEEGSIPRADVAAVAIACLDTGATHDRLFEVTGGGERSVRQALAGLR
jgi:uncharacterized protein YbjT (DUF2867 family)